MLTPEQIKKIDNNSYFDDDTPCGYGDPLRAAYDVRALLADRRELVERLEEADKASGIRQAVIISALLSDLKGEE